MSLLQFVVTLLLLSAISIASAQSVSIDDDYLVYLAKEREVHLVKKMEGAFDLLNPICVVAERDEASFGFSVALKKADPPLLNSVVTFAVASPDAKVVRVYKTTAATSSGIECPIDSVFYTDYDHFGYNLAREVTNSSVQHFYTVPPSDANKSTTLVDAHDSLTMGGAEMMTVGPSTTTERVWYFNHLTKWNLRVWASEARIYLHDKDAPTTHAEKTLSIPEGHQISNIDITSTYQKMYVGFSCDPANFTGTCVQGWQCQIVGDDPSATSCTTIAMDTRAPHDNAPFVTQIVAVQHEYALAVRLREKVVLLPPATIATNIPSNGESVTLTYAYDPRVAPFGLSSSGTMIALAVYHKEKPLHVFGTPVNGGWTQSELQSCTTTCGTGTGSYTRTCSNPYPEFGGAACSGSETTTAPCEKYESHWNVTVGACQNVPTNSHGFACGSGTRTVEFQCRFCDGTNQPDSNCSNVVKPDISTTCYKFHWRNIAVTTDCLPERLGRGTPGTPVCGTAIREIYYYPYNYYGRDSDYDETLDTTRPNETIANTHPTASFHSPNWRTAWGYPASLVVRCDATWIPDPDTWWVRLFDMKKNMTTLTRFREGYYKCDYCDEDGLQPSPTTTCPMPELCLPKDVANMNVDAPMNYTDASWLKGDKNGEVGEGSAMDPYGTLKMLALPNLKGEVCNNGYNEFLPASGALFTGQTDYRQLINTVPVPSYPCDHEDYLHGRCWDRVLPKQYRCLGCDGAFSLGLGRFGGTPKDKNYAPGTWRAAGYRDDFTPRPDTWELPMSYIYNAVIRNDTATLNFVFEMTRGHGCPDPLPNDGSICNTSGSQPALQTPLLVEDPQQYHSKCIADLADIPQSDFTYCGCKGEYQRTVPALPNHSTVLYKNKCMYIEDSPKLGEHCAWQIYDNSWFGTSNYALVENPDAPNASKRRFKEQGKHEEGDSKHDDDGIAGGEVHSEEEVDSGVQVREKERSEPSHSVEQPRSGECEASLFTTRFHPSTLLTTCATTGSDQLSYGSWPLAKYAATNSLLGEPAAAAFDVWLPTDQEHGCKQFTVLRTTSAKNNGARSPPNLVVSTTTVSQQAWVAVFVTTRQRPVILAANAFVPVMISGSLHSKSWKIAAELRADDVLMGKKTRHHVVREVRPHIEELSMTSSFSTHAAICIGGGADGVNTAPELVVVDDISVSTVAEPTHQHQHHHQRHSVKAHHQIAYTTLCHMMFAGKAIFGNNNDSAQNQQNTAAADTDKFLLAKAIKQREAHLDVIMVCGVAGVLLALLLSILIRTLLSDHRLSGNTVVHKKKRAELEICQ